MIAARYGGWATCAYHCVILYIFRYSFIICPHAVHLCADERWSDFVLEQVTVWQQIVLSWMTANPNHPLLVVKYEDLHLDTEAELMKMLDFLRAPYSASVVQELSLNLNDEEEEQLSVVYTVDEREYINSVIKSTIETLTIHKIDDTECDLSLYLRS